MAKAPKSPQQKLRESAKRKASYAKKKADEKNEKQEIKIRNTAFRPDGGTMDAG